MADAELNLKDRLLNELSTTIEPRRDEPLNAASALPPSVPDHTLLRVIGKGSYGEVWLARNVMGTPRAVKIVHRRAFDSDRPYDREFAGIRRFEPVSRSHPSQLSILHMGRNDAAACFYYVMELADDARVESEKVSGCESELLPPAHSPTFSPATYSPRTLRSDLQRRGRFPFDECLNIGLALATALDHLHKHGLVHRDIKPSNIVFVNGIPKLADIGLVTHIECTRSFVGTEGYLPPEGPGTPQADIFSLGKVLYEMATGRDRQDYPELPTNLIEVPSADRSALAELNEVIVKACHADATKRYQTAAELHADLALLQSGKSISRLRLVERRVRTLARAAVLVAAIAALAGGAFLYQQIQTRKARELARRNRELAEEKTSLANEKSKLADNLTRIGQENRERIVRLDIANGVRLLDESDPAGALLWFADALLLLTNNPTEESIHRIRIQQTLDQTPRVLRIFPHESGLNSAAFSPDGRLIMTATKDGNIRVWNAEDGTLKWGPKLLPAPAYFGRFTRDGKRVVLSSSADQGTFNGSLPPITLFAILDAETGEEWKWADGAFEGVVRKLRGAYFSPDDRWLATAHADGAIRIFDMENGRRTLELAGHTDAVQFISFSADGRFLASASVDRTVRLWRLPTGEPVGKPLDHRWPAVRVLLTDDGQRAITAAWENVGQDGGVEFCVWDTASGERLPQPIEVRDRIALFLAPGSNGPLFVQDRAPNFARAYNLEAAKEAPLDLKIKGIRSWDFTKDGSQMVLGLGDHVAQVVDTRSGAPLTKLFRHGGWGVNSVQFSPSGLELLTGCEDGNARVWDLRPRSREVARGRLPSWLRAGSTFRGRQEFGRWGSEFPVFLGGGATAVFNDKLQLVHEFRPEQPGTDIVSPLRAPNGKFWAITLFDSKSYLPAELRLGIVKQGEVQQVHLPHPDVVGDKAFTPDSRFVISTCGDNRIRFWSTSDGSLARTVNVPEGNHGELTMISPDGRTVMWQDETQSRSNSSSFLRFFDLDSGTFIGEGYEISPTASCFPVFSPSGEYVALRVGLGPVTILESRTGRLISSGIRQGALDWLHWSPEGRRLLTAGDNDEVLVWDVAGDSRPLRTLRTPGSTTKAARWSPDGRFIVTKGDDHRVRVWDAATGEMVAPAFEHSNFVSEAAIMNSNRLISVSYTGEPLRAWDLTETKLPAEVLGEYAKLLSGRRLSAAGTLLALKPEELAELNRSLRARAPQLFESAGQPDLETPRTSALQHRSQLLKKLGKLAEAGADNRAVLNVSPRDPRTPATCLDLSPYFNGSLEEEPLDHSIPGHGFLKDLPHGLQTLPGSNGVQFDLRGAIELNGTEAMGRLPANPNSVEGIQIRQKCHRIYFLQATGWRENEDTAIGAYVFHYADGTQQEIPILYGRDLRDWVIGTDSGEPRVASVAWRGTNDYWGAIRLFIRCWENPRPDVEIKSLDFVSKLTKCAPFLIAITAEP